VTADYTGTSDSVSIPFRYRGPSDSANGGYACGVLACRIHGPARVRLNRPPPLDRPLAVQVTAPDHATLFDGESVVAEGYASEPAWRVPPPVAFERAVQASQGYPWFDNHPFASCFVCGPERADRDGLRIFPGPIAERKIVAAPWTPDDTICDASGLVQSEVVWAALDCPSWFGIHAYDAGAMHALLGQLAARIVRRPAAAEACVVIGWPSGRDGRKLYGGTAIYGADRDLVASSAAVWIELQL
jgi:hypothetical protein